MKGERRINHLICEKKFMQVMIFIHIDMFLNFSRKIKINILSSLKPHIEFRQHNITTHPVLPESTQTYDAGRSPARASSMPIA